MKTKETIYILIAVLVVVSFRVGLMVMRGEMNSEYRAAHQVSGDQDSDYGDSSNGDSSGQASTRYQKLELIISMNRSLKQKEFNAIRVGMNLDEVMRTLHHRIVEGSEESASKLKTAHKGLVRFENPDSSDILVDFSEGIVTGARRLHVLDPASLNNARRGFETNLVTSAAPREPIKPAPPGTFRTIKYAAPKGAMAAYVSPDPGDGKKHPAIIWITGGDCNSIGDVWSTPSRSNDQTASAYRKAGIIMMFPSLRGGNTNPGQKEGFLGEVDDVLAAAKFLEKQSYVDPRRIYLGGHSTGGTLALLVAESSPRFRAVFAFGPVYNVATYGADSGFLPFNTRERKEVALRSPGYWLPSITSPTWVIEGTDGNSVALRAMAKTSTNPKAHFVEVKNATHFNVLAPTNELIARKILDDSGAVTRISLTSDEVNRIFDKNFPSRKPY